MTAVQVGVSEDGKTRVIDGEFIAKLMDTYGLSLEEYRVMCQKYGVAFTLKGFVRGLLATGNYSLKKIVAILNVERPDGLSEAFMWNYVAKTAREYFAENPVYLYQD